ncbi:MAG: GGDEF domain-containing protein, partial [Coriobacteriales bacterium]
MSEEINTSNKLNARSIIYISIVVIVCIFFEVFYGNPTSIISESDDALFSDEELLDFSDSWTNDYGDTVDLKKIATYMSGKRIHEMTLTSTVPDTLSSGSQLMFISSNINFDVSIDGEVIYSYHPTPPWYAGRAEGSHYHSIALDPSYAGETITLRIENIYPDSGGITDIFVGESGVFYQYEVNEFLPGFIISIIIITLGFIMLYVSFAGIGRDTPIGRSFFAFSVASLLIGLWSLEESMIELLFMGNSAFWRALTYPPLVFLPYFLVAMMDGWVEQPLGKIKRIVGILTLVDFAYCNIVYFAFGWDYHDCTWLIMGVIGFTVIAVFIIILKDFLSRIRKGLGSLPYLIAGFGMLAVFTVYNYVSYNFFGNSASDCASYVRIAYGFMIVLLIVEYVREFKMRIYYSSLAESYRKMALRDDLTGLGNRSAMNKRLEYLTANMNSDEVPMVVVGSVDINNLKTVNDTKGHPIGDIYIQTAASILL